MKPKSLTHIFYLSGVVAIVFYLFHGILGIYGFCGKLEAGKEK